MSGSDLYTTCTRSLSLLMGGNSAAVVLSARRACEGGLKDGWNPVATQLCGEGTPSVGQLEEIFVSWAGQHPAEAGVSVREATRRAFSQAFPCRPGPGQSTSTAKELQAIQAEGEPRLPCGTI